MGITLSPLVVNVFHGQEIYAKITFTKQFVEKQGSYF